MKRRSVIFQTLTLHHHYWIDAQPSDMLQMTFVRIKGMSDSWFMFEVKWAKES